MPSFELTAPSADQAPGPFPRPAPGDDAPSSWTFLRTLSTPPAPAADPAAPERDWTEEERLDELFSAWAEAALSAEVIADRRFMEEEDDEVAPASSAGTVAGPPAFGPSRPEVAVPDPVDEGDGAGLLAADVTVARYGPGPAWSPGDDDILPKPSSSSRRRWRR